MNRKERRRRQKQGLPVKKEATLNVKASDIQSMKQSVTAEAMDTAFVLMLAIPTMVIHDNYSKITRRVVDGKPREERFTDMCLDIYKDFQNGKYTTGDFIQKLKEYAGVTITLK